jgi:regulation of enolase protein 1 (concanavalin A-like superfamily)
MPGEPERTRARWEWRSRMLAALGAVGLLVLGAFVTPLGQKVVDKWFASPHGGNSASPSPPAASASTRAGCAPTRDEFSGERLDPGWEHLNGGAVAVTGGAVVVRADDGADIRSDIQGGVTAPFIARSVSGDFTAEAAVAVEPRYSYQAAGLLLYRDRDNYVRLERGFASFGAIVFEYAAEGRHTKLHGPFSNDADPVRTSDTVVRLRLKRTGTTVRAYWLPAGNSDWRELGGTAPLTGDAKAGVAVLNRSQPPNGDPARGVLAASFPYVDITC